MGKLGEEEEEENEAHPVTDRTIDWTDFESDLEGRDERVSWHALDVAVAMTDEEQVSLRCKPVDPHHFFEWK